MAFKGTVNYIDRFARVKSTDSTYNNTTAALDAALTVTLPKGVYKVEAFLPFTAGSQSGAKLIFNSTAIYTNSKSFIHCSLAIGGDILSTCKALVSTSGDTTLYDADNMFSAGTVPVVCFNLSGVIAVVTKGDAGFKIANSSGSYGNFVSTYYKGGWVKYTQLA